MLSAEQVPQRSGAAAESGADAPASQRGAQPAPAGAHDAVRGSVESIRGGQAPAKGRVLFAGNAGPQAVQLLDVDGLVRLRGLRALQQLMGCAAPRCHAHPRLALLLAKIAEHFSGHMIRIVSGYRRVGGYTQRTSRHTMGRASDIQVVGVSRRRVWNYCRSLSQTGCGYYPNSVFLHVDVRAQSAQWVDWSSPGERPRYGTLQRPYRNSERDSATRPRVSRRVTRPAEVALTVRVVDDSGRIVRLVDEQPQAAELAGLADSLLRALATSEPRGS